MTQLAHTVAIVTGASSGIGQACARALHSEGARLVLMARRSEKLEALARELSDRRPDSVLSLTVDVRDFDQVSQAVDGLPSEWRAVDILVNNAGLARALDSVHANKVSDIDTMVDTNVKGLLYVSRCVLPLMVDRGRGHVVNIGSTAGHEVYPGGVVYCASKHAVDAVTRGMKMDLHGSGIRVSTVDPGLVETEFSIVRFDGDEERAASVYEGMTPLSPKDVADAVLFCLTRPSHVNISTVILMPTDQSSSTMVHRRRDSSTPSTV